MATVPAPTRQSNRAFYAHFGGDAGYLTKVDDRLLFLAHGTTTPRVIVPADVCELDVLGEVGTATAAFVADQLAGGFAAICTQRQMVEV